MAAQCQIDKPVEVMMKNLKLHDPSPVNHSDLAAQKDVSSSDAVSCISTAGDATSSVKESEVDQESLGADQGIYYPPVNYYGYYYPGYDNCYVLWDENNLYYGYDGLDIQYPSQAVQYDDGSLVYYAPCVQPGYGSYDPYLPGTVTGFDGHAYFPGSVVPQAVPSSGLLPSPMPYGTEIAPAFVLDAPPVMGEGVHRNGLVANTAFLGPQPNIYTPNGMLAPSKPSPPVKSNSLGERKSSSPALDALPSIGVQSHSLKSANKASRQGSGFQAATVLSRGYFPISKLPTLPSQGKGGLLYPNNRINTKPSDLGWTGIGKISGGGKVNGISNFDLLNEQNCGPRRNVAKGSSVVVVDPVGSPVVGEDSGNRSTDAIRKDQYNLSDFPTNYDNALFYIIKSYSEDDVHKSIKYGVWASTPNGNKKLDCAYQDAAERTKEKGCKCPVFLFFSVNASGQFCGVAEMVDRVDFNKNMDFWQQDKWNGFFSVKWHIIKDVPNSQFRHIVLENNDNKPVTNSRDTQEVKFPKGVEMLKIFKNYMARTSILDDFEFYERRQKAMQDKRGRALAPTLTREAMQRRDGNVEATDIRVLTANGAKRMDLATTRNQGEPTVGSEDNLKKMTRKDKD